MRSFLCLVMLGLLAGPVLAQRDYGDFGRPTDPYDDTFRKAIPDERTLNVRPDTYEGLKPGYGREDTYYAFADCNLVRTIRGSSKSRGGWIKFIDENAEKCRLTDLSMEERDVILDYLTAAYGF